MLLLLVLKLEHKKVSLTPSLPLEISFFRCVTLLLQISITAQRSPRIGFGTLLLLLLLQYRAICLSSQGVQTFLQLPCTLKSVSCSKDFCPGHAPVHALTPFPNCFFNRFPPSPHFLGVCSAVIVSARCSHPPRRAIMGTRGARRMTTTAQRK